MMRRLLAAGPVLTTEELETLGKKVLEMTTADTVALTVDHRAQGVTRVRENRVRATSDGSRLTLSLHTQFGQRMSVEIESNQIDDADLRAIVAYAERVGREMWGESYAIRWPVPKRVVPPGHVWYERSAAALAADHHAVLGPAIDAVMASGLMASAFIGVSARSVLHLTRAGVNVAGQETDAEFVMTAWTSGGSGVGWAGQAARDSATLDPSAVAAQAIDFATRGEHPVAVEPGRRTVILGPAAVAQFAHAMSYAWGAVDTHAGLTPFSAAAMGARVMDERVTITSDPNDPDGGFLPFFRNGADGSPVAPMTWVDQGRLVNLAYDPFYSADLGRSAPASEIPYSLRLGAGTATVESMISACSEGIYVNRVASLTMLHRLSGSMTGVTQGGCFLVKDGKIAKPVKNLRFIDSPFVFLNNVIEIGAPRRAALGYTPGEDVWPLPPVIVPPLMVRDFNFTMLADAV